MSEPQDANPAGPPPEDRPLPGPDRQPVPSPSDLPTAPGEPRDASPRPEAGTPSPGASASLRRALIPWPWLRGLLLLPAFLLAQALGYVGMELLPASVFDRGSDGVRLAVAMLATLLPAILMMVVWWKWIAGHSQRELGHVGPPRRMIGSLAAGAWAGVVIMTLVVGVGLATGAWSVSLPTRIPWAGIALWTPVLLIAAYTEELLFRGHLLQEFGRRRAWVGAIASSAIFALIHMGNPNVLSGGRIPLILLSANIVAAGLLLCAAFLLSGDLWFPTGVHLGWNWAQSILFGLPVSGMEMPSFLAGRMREGGSPWSGSAFGPESSLVALVLLVALTTGAALLIRHRRCRLPVIGPRPHAPPEPAHPTLDAMPMAGPPLDPPPSV